MVAQSTGTVGRYRIVRELGRGGMAVVYEAVDPALNRRVALKVLAEHLTHDTAFVARFRTEAQAAAALSHPNIVTVYEVGQDGDKHYIAMEYLVSDLEERIEQRGVLSVDETVRIAAQVAGGLEAAHSRGLVHRDVKPSNIMFDAQDQAKIVDFGIVRMLEGTRLTSMGMSVGTPEYMSPEQAAGGMVDHRTDIYSLGIVMYEMLTGRVPFTASTPLAVAYMHKNEALPELRAARPDVPDWLERVIVVCTAKSPGNRWQRAADLAAALQTKHVSAPVATGPMHAAASPVAPVWQPSGAGAQHQPTDRRALRAGLIAVVAACALAVAVLGFAAGTRTLGPATSAEPETKGAAGAGAAMPGAARVEPIVDPADELRSRVRAWVAAWNNAKSDPEPYFSFYHPQTAGTMSGNRWTSLEELRRFKLSAWRDVKKMEVVIIGPIDVTIRGSSADTSHKQRFVGTGKFYASTGGRYGTTGTKYLAWERLNGQWLIAREGASD